MAEVLRSVGLDVGTTSTQMVVSQLTVENRASSFAVPELQITNREVCYRGQVHFTPLLEGNLVDGERLRRLVTEEYRRAGIQREMVDTGAVIVTGETSRRENARVVTQALAEFAGDFVVATAGPDLESVLAAKGSGAVAHSRQTGKTVLHMDIGGGTSNLCLIDGGQIQQTGCLNVGGRLVKVDAQGIITYTSPVLAPLTDLKPGEKASVENLENMARCLTQALEMAAGLREPTALLHQLTTKEAGTSWNIPKGPLEISFSGGVADCIAQDFPPFSFGDMGPILGKAIRESRLCQGPYRLGEETIRATVIGAGCHSTQLSGSTVFYRNVAFPLKNLRVVPISCEEQERDLAGAIRGKLGGEQTQVLCLPGMEAADYGTVTVMAEAILQGIGGQPVYVCTHADMAKALGQAMALRASPDRQVLCLDRVCPGPESYLDVGAPVGPALPVVVKTLVLER